MNEILKSVYDITQNVHNQVCVSLTHFTTPSEAFRVNSLAPVLPTDIGELTTPEEQTRIFLV